MQNTSSWLFIMQNASLTVYLDSISSMAEPEPLHSARQHLSQAETEFLSADGLYHLEEALALLEKLTLDGTPEHRSTATNLLSTYSTRICDSVKKRIESNPGLPEPDLKHLFNVLLAFDSIESEPPPYVRSLKIEVVRRLIDHAYEGYSEADKQKMLEQLAGIVEE